MPHRTAGRKILSSEYAGHARTEMLSASGIVYRFLYIGVMVVGCVCVVS